MFQKNKGEGGQQEGLFIVGEESCREWEVGRKGKAETIEFCQVTQHPSHRPEAVNCHLKLFLCNSPDYFLPLFRVFHCSRLDSAGSRGCWDAGIFTIGNIKDYSRSLTLKVYSVFFTHSCPPCDAASAAALQLTECFIRFNRKRSGLLSPSLLLDFFFCSERTFSTKQMAINRNQCLRLCFIKD